MNPGKAGARTVFATAFPWVACAIIATASTVCSAQDNHPASSGRAWLARRVPACSACHGPQGVSQIPAMPSLAGQYAGYLFQALKGYRDGGRSNAIMAAQVRGMTDAQLQALADYFAGQPAVLATPADN